MHKMQQHAKWKLSEARQQKMDFIIFMERQQIVLRHENESATVEGDADPTDDKEE